MLLESARGERERGKEIEIEKFSDGFSYVMVLIFFLEVLELVRFCLV